MKKIVVFIALFVFLSFAFSFEKKQLFIANLFQTGTCEIYASGKTNKNLPEFASVVTSGNDIFVRADIKLCSYLIGNMQDIKGITIFAEGSAEYVLNELKVKISSMEKIGESNHIFGFSPYFSDFVFIKNKKCNIHIVQVEENLVVGSPIIFGSY